jgi:hypothetical protein
MRTNILARVRHTGFHIDTPIRIRVPSLPCTRKHRRRTHAYAQEEAQPLSRSSGERVLILLFAVATEVFTWGLLMVAGVVWILTAPNTDLVIRSTVSVMFVLNVDEIVFESCASKKIREDVEETKYRIPVLMNKCGLGKTQDFIAFYFGLYLYLPLVALTSTGVVVYMRWALADCWSVTAHA